MDGGDRRNGRTYRIIDVVFSNLITFLGGIVSVISPIATDCPRVTRMSVCLSVCIGLPVTLHTRAPS